MSTACAQEFQAFQLFTLPLAPMAFAGSIFQHWLFWCGAEADVVGLPFAQ